MKKRTDIEIENSFIRKLDAVDGRDMIVLLKDSTIHMEEWRNSRKTDWHIYGHIRNRRNTAYEFI